MTRFLARHGRVAASCALMVLFLSFGARAEVPLANWTGGLGPQDAELGNDEMPQTLLFGSALAADDATVLSGMPEYNSGKGRVAVFSHRGPGDWVRSGTLSTRDAKAGDLFGSGVAIAGDTALVVSQRALYVFQRRGGKWSQLQRIGVNNNEWLIGSVQLSGTWAAVGVDNPDGTSSVLVLQKDAKGRWAPRTRLRAFDQAPYGGFGYSLALWNDTLVAGAPGQDEQSGAAYLFKRIGTRWAQQQKLLPFDGAAAGNFGHSVALQGNVVVVGAPQANYEGGFYAGYEYLISGSAYVFSRQGARFAPLQKLRPNADENSWYWDLGENVAIANGRIAVAAAWPVTRWDPSYIFVYELHRRSYVLQSMLPGDPSTGDGLALTGSALIAGCPFDPYFSIGQAFVHEFELVE